MAEFRDVYKHLRAADADVVALSVDPPERSEVEQRRYHLPFPLLCDTRCEIVQAWDLFNREEKGGIAISAVFLLDQDRRVLYAATGGTVSRIRAADLLAYVRAHNAAHAAPRNRVIIPTLWEMARTAWPAVRLTFFPPKR